MAILTGYRYTMPRQRALRDEDLDAVIDAVLRATQAFVGLALRSLEAAGGRVAPAQHRPGGARPACPPRPTPAKPRPPAPRPPPSGGGGRGPRGCPPASSTAASSNARM